MKRKSGGRMDGVGNEEKNVGELGREGREEAMVSM